VRRLILRFLAGLQTAPMKPSPSSANRDSLDPIREQWQAAWPRALAVWSPFLQLSEPRWCNTAADEQREQLSGSFAMIRLLDHAVVISLRQIHERKLAHFAAEILAHEIGHHVLCPANLNDNARLLARVRAGLPTKEPLAGFIANLYADLLINDRLQRSAQLDIAGVYRALSIQSADRMWWLYLRIYELLWSLPPESLAKRRDERRLEYDAQLGARLIRSYARDWLDGAGRFAALCLPYLLDDDAKEAQRCFSSLHDTRTAGAGGMPDGLAEVDEEEVAGAIHPSEDAALSGLDQPPPVEQDAEEAAAVSGADVNSTGYKSLKRYRQPLEYLEVLRAAGGDGDEAAIVANYYRERALPHLIPFPSKERPPSFDPLPEGLENWEAGEPIEAVDWIATLLNSPVIVPGITTRQRYWGSDSGQDSLRIPLDLYLGVDCSGSMANPAVRLSYPVLAGAVMALSALRAGARVMVALSGEPGRTLTTEGFSRDERLVMRTLTSYLGSGYSFGIHRLDEVFARRGSDARPAHILIVSDTDMFSMLDSESHGRLGWDAAREAVVRAQGGATFVLEIPYYQRDRGENVRIDGPIRTMQGIGWDVAVVSTQEELVAFARRFSNQTYTADQRTKNTANEGHGW
jgi:hypothetical protein